MNAAKYRDLVTDRGGWRWDEPAASRSSPAPPAIPLHYGFPYPQSYPLTALTQALQQVMETEGAAALNYGGAGLAGQLAELIAGRSRERGIPAEAADMVITHGAAQGIGLVCDLLVNPGDVVLVEAPTYMGALDIFRRYRAQLVEVNVDAGGLCPHQLAAVLQELPRGARPKLLYTIPNFHNPTGATLALSRRPRVLELAEEHNFLVLEDDAYGELRYAGETLPSLRQLDRHERVLQLGTMSKILAPAVRIGWVSAPPALSRQLERMRSDGGANPLMKAVATAFWQRTPWTQRVEQLRHGYAQRRDAMLQALESQLAGCCHWTQPEGGYFVWLTFPAHQRVSQRLDEFLQAGVHPLPGTSFYAGGRGDNQLRLSFSYPEPDAIVLGVQRIAQVLGAPE